MVETCVMRRQLAAQFWAWCGVLCALAPRAAHGAEGACAVGNISADAALSERFPDLVRRVRDEVLARNDIDACARIALSLRDSSIVVEVALPDGRSASRAAQQHEDVIPTLQALLLVPRRAADPAALAPARSTDSEVRRAPERARKKLRQASEVRRELAPLPADSAGGVGVELSVLGGARVGDGQASFGLGAMSFLDLSGWLVGFEGRADRYQLLAGGGPETALELGALFGRRLRVGGVTLDVAGGPAVAIKGTMSDTEVVMVAMGPAEPPPPPPRPERSSGPAPRMLAGVRLGFSPGSVFRTFVSVDGSYGATRAEGNPSSGSPRLPSWTLGLALGATVGTR
jgi:hypothetical protein